MCDAEIQEIIWCHGVTQKLHAELAKQLNIPIKFYEGIPCLEVICKSNAAPKIIIIDDLMGRFSNEIVELFTMNSHHFNISIFNCVQNIFHKSKGSRDVSLNSHYIVFFNNPRDRSQISHFARQINPRNSKFIVEAYEDATSNPHGYILFDCTQKCDEDKRIRSNIFPGDVNLAYVAKNSVASYK
jgi:hypothetical protein